MKKLNITLILLSCALRVLTENRSNEAQAKIDNILQPAMDKPLLQKQFSHAYTAPKEEPSFMSKVASWIFPFGGTSETPLDTSASETQHRYAPQYLPSQQGYYKQPCNPCNKEPWIPVAGTHGQDTVIGFVQQSHIQNHGYSSPPNNYQQQANNLQNFKPPPLIPESLHGSFLAQQQHGSVLAHQHNEFPRDQYGAPTNTKPIFNRPPENFRAPVQHILPPPLPKYTAPLFKNIGFSPQKLNPLKQGFSSSKHGILKSGPSKFRLNPPPQHGPPIPLTFGKPQLDKYKFSLPPTVTKSPLLNNDFKPPSASAHSANAYSSTRGNEGIVLQPPPFNIDYIVSPLPNYESSLNSGTSNNNQLLTQNYNSLSLPPLGNTNLFSDSKYNYPNTNFGKLSNSFNKSPFPELHLQQNRPSYNTQPFQTGFSSQAFDNLQQHESKVTIQTNSEHSVQDVQVIPSIRIADYLASIDHPINVIQSPLVEVIATENEENRNSEPPKEYSNSKVQLNKNPIIVENHDEDTHAAATAQNLSYYNPNYNEKQNNDKNVQTSLEYNNHNLNNNKENSLFQTLIPGFSDQQLKTILQNQNPSEELPEFNVNFTEHINNEFPQSQINNTQQNDSNIYKGIENQFSFTQPPMDYSNWSPTFGTLSTSMVPPPIGQYSWNTEYVNRQVTSTTKKPKQVQIIIPYISNNPTSLSSNTNLYNQVNENIRGSKEHHINSAEVAVDISSPSLPLYTQPPSIEESVWSHYITKYNQEGFSEPAVSTEKSTSISNIRDILLTDKQVNNNFNKLPFDVIRLQKNIDDWTEQEFSNALLNSQKASTSAKLAPSKNIPSEYLTTQPYDKTINEVTTQNSIPDLLYDHEPAGSQTKISKVESNKDIDTNFIITETTPFSAPTAFEPLITSPTTILTSTAKPLKNATTTAETGVTTKVSVTNGIVFNHTLQVSPNLERTPSAGTLKPLWEQLQVSFSPLTREKIYVVTPQPWKFTPKEINEKLLAVTESLNAVLTSPKFSVVIQPGGNKRIKELTKDANGGLQVVYSEWPHLINNLQTTTTTEKPKTTNHPLLGLMDLSSYTPPPNSTVETYSGHSKVITVVTPNSVAKTTRFNDKKTTTKTISRTTR